MRCRPDNHPDVFCRLREAQSENAALRDLLCDWYILFSQMRRDGTEGAKLLDRTQQALFTEFRYAVQIDACERSA